MNSVPKVILGALAGAAVGALIAGAFTEEGDEVIKKAVKGSKDLTSNLKDKLDEVTSNVKDTVADTYQSVKQTASDFVSNASDKGSGVASNLK